MRCLLVLQLICATSYVSFALGSGNGTDIQKKCCGQGASYAATLTTPLECSGVSLPDSVETDELTCLIVAQSCCEKKILEKGDCASGVQLANTRECNKPTSEVAKICCEECSFGIWTGETQGGGACGERVNDEERPFVTQRKNAFFKCCIEAANSQETTTAKRIQTTTEVKESCKENSCEHLCDDGDGRISCRCRSGFRLQSDNKSCKDINECAEAVDDVCTIPGTVCHNTPGSFRCLPLNKRDARDSSCPPGFKWNEVNRVCDDINECQLPRPPCPKYLCENTIGGYKCAGQAGTPVSESPGATVQPASANTVPGKNDICPPGFRAGPDDECLDIDECTERLDDCQRLSQYCINTHGSFFCQDHVSKRCAPGFKVNAATRICEDIDECSESTEVCRRNETCVNLPGAYNCKSKISTLPKLSKKICQEGTRTRPGGNTCEDIDECREGTHLCDQFQNCINTFGGHECRCKSGFELDSSTGSCVDIDECALKLDNCPPGMRCVNILGSFTCRTSTVVPATSTPAAPPPEYEYEYYDDDEENATVTTPTEPKPISPPRTSSLPTTTTSTTTTTTTTSTTTTTTPAPTTTTLTPTTTTPTPTTPPLPPSTTTRLPRPRVRPRPRYPFRTTTIRTTIQTQPTIRPNTQEMNPSSTPKPRTYLETVTLSATIPANRSTIDAGSEIDTNDIPKDKWTNIHFGEDAPKEPDFNINDLYCLFGYEKNAYGDCVDVNECVENRHICSSLEVCQNRPGGYVCDCIAGYQRDPTGWCVVVPTNTTTKPTTTPITTIPTTTVRVTPAPQSPPEVQYTPVSRQPSPRPRLRPTTEAAYSPQPRHYPENPRYPSSRQPEVPYPSPSRPSPEVPLYPAPSRPQPEVPYTPVSRQPTEYSTTTTTTTTRKPTEATLTTAPELPYSPPSGLYPETPYSPRPSQAVPYSPPSRQPAEIPYSPPLNPRRPYSPPQRCELGYTWQNGECIDTDECATNAAQCSPSEECVNIPGGYRCTCRGRCRSEHETPSYGILPRQQPSGASSVITVGAQYGQPGPSRYTRPRGQRLADNTILYSCPWGYSITPGKRCIDIDECARNTSQCSAQQRCENFYGGYSCQCPAGHKLVGANSCDDIDECAYGRPCSYNARCVNTAGSYRCECGDGFRNAPSNDKVCIDVDECAASPAPCEHNCVNAWGGYRCYCKLGYRLNSDNRTCSDVDECAEWASSRVRGRLCAGECVNEPGSYRCACPAGYRLAEDARSCIDIDECDNGEARCAHSTGEVCQNTRGGYHCHRIDCPPGYRLESKHMCTRIDRQCPYSDLACLHKPSMYLYNFVTFVSNIYLPMGSVDLFTMRGPAWADSELKFELNMIDARAEAPGVRAADYTCFDARPSRNTCVISLLCSLQGPQVVELELLMSLYQHDVFSGSAVSRLIVIVSQYDF